jgi:hypothetical protein
VCPNKDKPGVHAAAEKAYKVWLEILRKRNKKRKDRPLDYNKLSERDKASMRKSDLKSLCVHNATDEASTITADSSHPHDPRKNSPTKRAKMTILIIDVSVLSSASLNKSILLAPIVTNFPHIHLQLGTELDCPKCPVLRCVVDTAATLTMGNFHFVVAVAKRYPHCVAKIFAPEDYNPIVLSGIVQRGGKSVTTELMVGFQFHLPYLMKDGSHTRIVIATGPHMTVNTIVGLPFIQATQAIIDLSDNVANLRTIDAPSFPIKYCRAMVHVPVIEEGADCPVHLTASEQALIQDINHLKAYFSSIDVVAGKDSVNHHVSFGSCPGKSFPVLPPASPYGFVNSPMEYYSDLGMGPTNNQWVINTTAIPPCDHGHYARGGLSCHCSDMSRGIV